MERTKFTAGLDGAITAEIFKPDGTAEDLTGCQITLKIAYENDDNAIVSLLMNILTANKCITYPTPSDTDMLIKGEYEINLIIIDSVGKKHATEKEKISIYNIIE